MIFVFLRITYLPPEEVAAIFFEPIAGDCGIIVPPKKYVQGLYNLCQQHGILFVVDEIQQAFGRAGKWFCIENFEIEPDLIVLGKSCGAGFPLGIVVGRSAIMECLDAPAHAFTLAGNTTACVAALKMIEIFERDDLINKSKKKGECLRNKLYELKNKYPHVIKDIRGLGLSIGVDLVDKYATKKICYQCIQNGLLLISLGEKTLRIQPPLVITFEQLDKSINILENSINDYLNNNISDEAFEFIKGW
ncbi:MAG: aminotransferase class III-fold pyridoxal phosphate-dependent enzyme [Terrisporobacter sp.]|uniref:aminotransferase class III-fold pyridoxal phosphate-dependent enzyme n=1 Tax=Terrisporobacter sp. TaxID=1965305 RepID=UPI002FC81BAA